MFEAGQRVGVAVSGGADSVCLLRALHALASEWGLAPAVLHVDHRWRGEASRADAAFVREMAAALGLPFHLREATDGPADPNREQAAREVRLQFFREFLTSRTLERIATGHTLDDQAETVLYRLLRGSAAAGLCGILPVAGEGIVRPLIETTRAEVEEYLKGLGQSWCEDATNADPAFVRNRIRRDLLPSLAAVYNPNVRQALARTARLALEDEQYFSEIVKNTWADVMKAENGAVVIDCHRLLSLPPAVSRRLLREGILRVKGDVRSIDFDHIEESLALAARSDGTGRIQIPGVDVFRSFDWLRLAPPSRQNLANRDYSFSFQPPARCKVPGEEWLVSAEILENPGDNFEGRAADPRYNEFVSELEWDKQIGRLELRNWRPGDQYRRVGHENPEKIKFLFQEARVPLWKRRSWPIITDGDVILWAYQFGAAAEYAATGSSLRVLRISVIVPGS
jgi:tRNA(Ile)-lysidine synthase